MTIRWTAAAAGCALLAGAALLAGCGTARPGQAGNSPSAAVTTTQAAAPASPAASSGGQCQAALAKRSQPAGAQHTLTGVEFVSPQQGWVVGGDRILATSDGGAHWQIQDRGNLDLTSVDFINAADGWAVGPTTLLATTDGGAHWTALPEPCPLLDSVHFVSPATGFAVAGGTVTPYQQVPPTGGVLLSTGDGGRTWHQLAAPADVQGACFSSRGKGWLGAHGGLYHTDTGGAHWIPATSGPTGGAGQPYLMTLQCAGPGSVWAQDLGTGAAMSHAPVIGYHGGPGSTAPVFAEQYFPHQGVTVTANAPGTYPGPMSAISPGTAVVIGSCPPCGNGTAPWDLLTASGAVITPQGNIGGLNEAAAASFLTPQLGWVVGDSTNFSHPANPIQRQRIVMTTDGGRSWHTQYTFRS
ncbi:MAG TPA: YCF48-related protein [Streptosporangiaceae bacterium]|jgi:photosystem II stability/assembly factor-like uncharacterized protein|nr:YCF48-related protein [Streptosporangiaceae bacterium]